MLDAQHLALLGSNLDVLLHEDGAHKQREIMEEVEQQNHHNSYFWMMKTS